jgi:hypothetical protein
MNEKRKIVISPGFGAGFATWCDSDTYAVAELPTLVAYVESGGTDEDQIKRILREAGLDDDPYMGGASNLEVVQVTPPYTIIEYDGHEYVVDASELRQ